MFAIVTVVRNCCRKIQPCVRNPPGRFMVSLWLSRACRSIFQSCACIHVFAVNPFKVRPVRISISRILFLFAFSAIAAVFFFGCSPAVNYSVLTLPQEGSAPPEKITADQDSVAGCTVYWKGKSWTYDMRERFALLPNDAGAVFMNRNEARSLITIKMFGGSCRVYRRPEGYEAIDPCLTPDGKRFCFSRPVHGSWNIYEMDLDGSPAITRITNDRYYNFYPRYFPDGSRILFCHTELQPGREKGSVVPGSHLWSAGLGASSSAVIEYGEGFEPSFVPKTNKVVFVRPGDSGRTSELHLMDLLTGSDTCIFGQPGRGAADPEVSPSGSMVAFVSITEAEKTPANLDIYTVNIDGTGLKQRTYFPGEDICPRWSADGKSLFFLSQRGTQNGAWNIWKMQLAEFAAPKTDSAVQAPSVGQKPVGGANTVPAVQVPAAVPKTAAPASGTADSTKPVIPDSTARR